MQSGNFYIGPSSNWIVESLVKKWCDDNPMPETFEDEDSWHWAIYEMHDLLKQLQGKKYCSHTKYSDQHCAMMDCSNYASKCPKHCYSGRNSDKCSHE